ncbi:MAG: membrane protein insertase YidC [Alphaproteobacteria bacterium]|nr:membrane protein insertase YidC [Alphaproteobacteria bacterium]
MEENNRNLFLVVVLSIMVMAGWQYFIVGPQMKAEQARQSRLAHQEKGAAAPAAAPGLPSIGDQGGRLARPEALKLGGSRVAIDTPTVDGSLLLKGARFDDLRLKKYRETVDPRSPEIVLLAPKKTAFPYYVDLGWISGAHVRLPDDATPWKLAAGTMLKPGSPVTLTWDNGQGLIFTRTISVDDKYMFQAADSVRNTSKVPVSLYPYARVVREGVPKTQHYWVLHEGFVGAGNGSSNDASYDDFKDDSKPPKTFSSTGGWAAITDKYWMAALVPPQNEVFNAEYRSSGLPGGARAYQANYHLGPRIVTPGAAVSVTHRVFAGAKLVDVLQTYEKRQNISLFDYAIDWGWFWFITRPLFWVLDRLFQFLGNFGVAILALTVVVKLITFPIANASAKTMAKMKKVQPEMEAIKARLKDDPAKQQQEIMELYRREKVNPLTGCVPQLLVIPIFFSLYKVFFVTIEMYHAPFFGWIRDLSAPDPTSILNLFGLLPYHIPAFVPGFISIGIWPILMGITQWVQTKLNPPAADPVQQRMFALMPLMFTFMFATFASGLVIYYAWNNLLTIAQQMVIMRRQKVPIHLFENFRLPAPLRRAEGRPQAGE